jgi:hypothetical protein
VELKIGIVKLKNQTLVTLLFQNVGLNHGMNLFQQNVMLLMPFVLRFGIKLMENNNK